MKRILAFILLVFYMNTSLFLSQVPQENIYDSSGNQLDNICSVLEFIMVRTGLDHHVDNEDSNGSQNIHVSTSSQYTFQPFSQVIFKEYSEIKINSFVNYCQPKISPVSSDIIIPPPKA